MKSHPCHTAVLLIFIFYYGSLQTAMEAKGRLARRSGERAFAWMTEGPVLRALCIFERQGLCCEAPGGVAGAWAPPLLSLPRGSPLRSQGLPTRTGRKTRGVMSLAGPSQTPTPACPAHRRRPLSCRCALRGDTCAGVLARTPPPHPGTDGRTGLAPRPQPACELG